MACAPSEVSDQPGHPPSLIKDFAIRMKKAWVLSYPLSTQRRLIRLGGCPDRSESSRGARSFCWFCHEAAHFLEAKNRSANFIFSFLFFFFFFFFFCRRQILIWSDIVSWSNYIISIKMSLIHFVGRLCLQFDLMWLQDLSSILKNPTVDCNPALISKNVLQQEQNKIVLQTAIFNVIYI